MLCWCNRLTKHENSKSHPYIIDFQLTQSWDQHRWWLSQRDLLFKRGVPHYQATTLKKAFGNFLMPFEQK